MRTVTIEDIREANAAGLAHRDSDTYWSYYTPTLQRAYDLGYRGVSIADAPLVAGYRYGAAPESFISRNYRDDRSECGLSLAAVDGEDEVGNSMWFADRPRLRYTGVLAARGSDGEAIILCTDATMLD